jgi:hypothetical protein
MLRFVLLILSLFNIALCFAEFPHRLMLRFVRLNSVFFFVLLLDFRKVKVKCCKCAPMGAR